MSRGNRSQQLFDAAKKVIPGGVDSPVRAFKAVGGEPLFIERGEGAFITDVDGNRYIDYVMSWGPLILGHAHPRILSALAETAALGTSFGAPSELELELATRVRALMPAIDMIRFVNSGTEATMSALRLARAFTGRHKIIKFEGNYHGHADALLAKAGSGVATLGLPDSPGVTPGAAQDTLLARYNDSDSVAALFEQHPREIAAVIVEPVAGNMGLIAPHDGFLAALRELTKQHGALLIFDEVMTGFRVHPGGAQALYGITPDLTTLGKVIGGGLPVGAYGGRRDIMEMVAPQGPMYQAGTLSGNPLAMRAGIETLDAIKDDGVWQDFERRGDALVTGLRAAAADARVSIVCDRIGTMFGLFFSDRPVHNWDDAATCDTDRFGHYFRALLANGVYVAPSQFEVGFLSTAHDDDVIEQTVSAARQAFAAL